MGRSIRWAGPGLGSKGVARRDFGAGWGFACLRRNLGVKGGIGEGLIYWGFIGGYLCVFDTGGKVCNDI